MSSAPLRPVVALDVDGVINFDSGPLTHELFIPAAAQPKSPFVRGYGEVDRTLTIHVDPTIGEWITSLREHADVVWATTWEEAANTHLAPLLGIDPLPVACSVLNDPPRFGYVKNGDSVAWKASVLLDAFPRRPLVWVDDGAWRWAPQRYEIPDGQSWVDWRCPQQVRHPWALDDDDDTSWRELAAPTLVLAPEEATGLTVEMRATIAAFLADPYGYVHQFPSYDD